MGRQHEENEKLPTKKESIDSSPFMSRHWLVSLYLPIASWLLLVVLVVLVVGGGAADTDFPLKNE